MIRVISALALFLAPPSAEARSTNACFTPDEVKTMVLKRDAVSKAASDCLKNYWNSHVKFFNSNKYSKYFGNRNKAIDTPNKRARAILLVLWPDILPQAELQKFNAMYANEVKKKNPKAEDTTAGLTDLEKYMEEFHPQRFKEYLARRDSLNLVQRAQEERGQEEGKRGSDLRGNTNLPMQNISCVDMTRRCLREGFKAAGMESTYEKVDKEVRATDLSGVEMQKALSDLGWKVLFWNPDPEQNAAWDKNDQEILPLKPAAECTPTADKPCPKPMVWQGAWGGHASRFKRVQERDEYFLGKERPLMVDDKRLLVGFRTSVPAQFKAVPFWVGTAHSGYHVFPGFSGQIIEAHSMRAIRSKDNLEVSTFNPLEQEKGGGPKWTNTERYRSGIIVVPPGYLDDVSKMYTPKTDAQGCVDLKPIQGK